MNYSILARQLLNILFRYKKHGHRNISENMQGEAMAIMYILNHSNTVSPTEMSIEMNISSARVAAMLNSLEDKELVTRQIDKTDRRKILVSLTEKGQKMAEEHNKKCESHTAKILELLGEHDATELVRIIEKLVTLTPKLKEDECN